MAKSGGARPHALAAMAGVRRPARGSRRAAAWVQRPIDQAWRNGMGAPRQKAYNCKVFAQTIHMTWR